MKTLSESLKESLSKNIIPVSIDFLENEMDTFISDGTFRSIPILNSICGVIKVGKDLHERNLLKQTFAFLSEFNSGTIDEGKLQKYKERLESNKEKTSELERVLLILNNNIDVEKSKYLARLFTAYINEKITWDEFCEFSDMTNRLFIEDFRLLKALWSNGSYLSKGGDNFRAERIYSVGIIGIRNNNIVITGEPQGLGGRCLNLLGQKYCDIIFREGDS